MIITKYGFVYISRFNRILESYEGTMYEGTMIALREDGSILIAGTLILDSEILLYVKI